MLATFWLLLSLVPTITLAYHSPVSKTVNAVRTPVPPIIDGQLLDVFIFKDCSSGVIRDSRCCHSTFSAAWESYVAIDQEGQAVGMRIPCSAIWFPANGKKIWGLQVHASIRRHREKLQRVLVPKGAANTLAYLKQMRGLKDIDPPLPLALTPHVSAIAKHFLLFVVANKETHRYRILIIRVG